MPLTDVDVTGPIVSAKITGKLYKAEVGRLQAAGVRRSGAGAGSARSSFSKTFQG